MYIYNDKMCAGLQYLEKAQNVDNIYNTSELFGLYVL